jgi:hypothetical protein
MTEQTQTTGQPAAFPEREIRQAFTSWDDQKTIQGQWSSWDESRRAEFSRLVEDTDPADLSGAVAGFLDQRSGGAELTEPSGSTPGGDGTSTPAADGTGGSSAQTGGGQQNAGEPSELDAALDTIESAEDYADEHPDQIEALLAAEQAREKPRKTLVESLERAARRRDRDAEGKQGE